MPAKKGWIVRKEYQIKEGDLLGKIKVLKIYYDKHGNVIKKKTKIIDH